MGIGGINDYSSYFNNFKVPSIPTVSVDEVKKQDEQRVASESQAPLNVANLEDVRLPEKPRKDAAIEDISLTFNKGDDYGYIGKDSNIYSLDVENAISDMQKDNVLKQYQYYAGSAQGALVDNADGVVVPKLF